MPIVGIEQVPRELQRPSFLSDVGYGQGKFTHDALLMALQSILGGGGGIGQVPTAPMPGNPGKLTFPSGASTPTSPLEMAQIRQMGGVPNTQGSITPLGQGGVNFIQPTRLGIRPDLAYQQAQATLQKTQQANDPNSPENQAERLKLQKIQQDLDPNSPDNKFKDQMSKYLLAHMPGTTPPIIPSTTPSPTSSSSSTGPGYSPLQAIADKADAGSEIDQMVIRYILSHQQGPS